MKNICVIITVILYSQLLYGQTDYFGSIVIPKQEYLLKLANNNLYMNLNNQKDIQFTNLTNIESHKLIFIPAGKGYYFIKLVKSGFYLTIKDNNLLQMQEPDRTDIQKFKVIRVGSGKFKIIALNGFAVSYSYPENKAGKVTANSFDLHNVLKISAFKNKQYQLFEILEADNNKRLN